MYGKIFEMYYDGCIIFKGFDNLFMVMWYYFLIVEKSLLLDCFEILVWIVEDEIMVICYKLLFIEGV